MGSDEKTKGIRVTLDVPPTNGSGTGSRLEVNLLPGGAPTAPVAPQAHPDLLEGIGRIGPALRDRAADLIGRLKALEPEMLDWMNQSPDNARQFVTDPVGALRAAGVDESLAADLEAFAADLAARADRVRGCGR